MPNRKKIPIIDDDKFIAKIIQIFLEKKDYKIILAINGVEGLEAIKSNNPDLILCDRNMPELSGYGLLQKIRTSYPKYNSIPFIFLTALDDSRDKYAASELSPSAYLTKPIDFDKLFSTVALSLSA
jgi:DNA-binding response OmpR family regulator